jgi:phenylacetate-CoA ligase
MDPERLRALQLRRLNETLAFIMERAPAQRKKLEDAGYGGAPLRSLKEIEKLPFTYKKDFHDNYPFGLFAADKRDVLRLQGTSGTTGKPTINGYTRSDMELWKDLIARIARAVGVTGEDTAQISFGYGLFTGGFGLHQGLEHIGVTVLPLSSGNTDRQLMMMEDMGVTVLVATPSYALYLSEAAREHGLGGRLKLRVGLFGGEGCTPEMRKTIEDNLGIVATNNYGLCEITGPGVSGECIERNGQHIAEDHFYAEIIDPDTERVLPLGEKGELVLTTLTRRCVPVIRYRTRDITRLMPGACPCGRTHVRMTNTLGRSDDMMIIKGVNVFPSQIESVLVGMEHIGPHYLLLLRREGLHDTLEVQVELAPSEDIESYAKLEGLTGRIREKLRSVLGLNVKVTLVAPQTIERFQGKAKRVVDLRNG